MAYNACDEGSEVDFKWWYLTESHKVVPYRKFQCFDIGGMLKKWRRVALPHDKMFSRVLRLLRLVISSSSYNAVLLHPYKCSHPSCKRDYRLQGRLGN